jgi:phenylalanyl-tRNA synthetase beta chain
MKISLGWLNQYLSHKISAEEAEEILTNVGLEVEEVEVFESIRGGLVGVVIGEVVEKEKHPDADRLSVTQVDIGTGTLLQIVCGAPNVAAGQKVVVATVGTILYPGGEKLEIKKSKIRGVESQGMICAEDELGLGTSHDGIMVLPAETPVGLKASAYFQLENDVALELNITPNRSDATSHIGVARDVVAYQGIKNPSAQLIYPEIPTPHKNADLPFNITIQNTEACPRYSGVVVTDIQVGPSPTWLQNKLKTVGLRPINNVVDITNYVQFELGHPLHAFDLSKIDGQEIIIKNATDKSVFITLDGVERTLTENDLMICSATQPLCIAGVFGGAESGVTEQTQSVFIESAYFSPVSIRRTSKVHGLKTDASFRFERGADPNITLMAAARAAQLLVEIAGGKIASDMLDIYPQKIEPKKLSLSYQKIHQLLGIEISKENIHSILKNLGIEIEQETGESMVLNIPAFKVDVAREVDVIEEIIRIYGLNEIKINNQLSAVFTGTGQKSTTALKRKVADHLVGNGYFEILTNSLLSSKYQLKLTGEINSNAVSILNPISAELDILRNDFIYSGLEVVAHNLNHKSSSVPIFEFGKTYHHQPGEAETFRDHYFEQQVLGVWLCGASNSEAWYEKETTTNFYHIKGCVESILNLLKVPTKPIQKVESNFYKTGFEITGFKNAKLPLVKFGEVAQNLLKNVDIKQPVFYAEFNWDLILEQVPTQYPVFAPLPKYPSVRRDLALILDKAVEYGALKEIAYKAEKQLLQEVNIFDVYEGKGIPEGKKSYALSFIFRDKTKTLTDADIDKSIQRLIEQFKKEFNAEIRS